MENNKRVIILVSIALILAITAITLSLNDSETPTVSKLGTSPTGAVIGLEITPGEVEDKLVNQNSP
jgi:hypothetical protein